MGRLILVKLFLVKEDRSCGKEHDIYNGSYERKHCIVARKIQHKSNDCNGKETTNDQSPANGLHCYRDGALDLFMGRRDQSDHHNYN